MKNNQPKTLQEAVVYFSNESNCIEYLAAFRWPDGVVVCPTCGSTKVSFLENQNRWQCSSRHSKRQFSIKVGTIFEDSPISLTKWLPVMWMIANCKNGVSSWEIHRAIGVTQKTAWFMLHRIRLAMKDESADLLSGEIEADETYIGGKAINMHAKKKERKVTGMIGKAAVLGLLERDGNARTMVVEDAKRRTVIPIIRESVEKGSTIYTDYLATYRVLADEYIHQIVDHAETYVKGRVHTNGLENFWSLLKRGIKGTYVAVEPFHLFRYLDEQTFRFNMRKGNDAERFSKVVKRIIGKRITYKELIGKEGQTQAV